MSKFRRVSETENIPSFIEKRFVGAQVEVEEDPYAELRANSTENRIKISKQQIGMEKEATSLGKSWEKISGASVYNDLRSQTLEDRLASQEFGSIRRSDHGYDDGENVRTTTSGLKAFSQEDYLSAMLSRSASIFNPDMIDITQQFLESQESTSQQSIVDQAHAREAKTSRHASWEQKQLSSIRESKVINSRAHSVLRTSADSEFSTTFGMIDPSLLDQRESMRIANQNRVREQRLAIKNDKHEIMTANSQQRAKTVADIYNNINISFDDED